MFDISVMDLSVEGILWLKIVEYISKAKLCHFMCVFVTYPLVLAAEVILLTIFFDCLATQIFTYRHLGCICICNARCGRLDDGCDPSVNGIPKRMVIDEVQNTHGKQFIDFLKAAGLCTLNGRGQDNFTYI